MIEWIMTRKKTHTEYVHIPFQSCFVCRLPSARRERSVVSHIGLVVSRVYSLEYGQESRVGSVRLAPQGSPPCASAMQDTPETPLLGSGEIRLAGRRRNRVLAFGTGALGIVAAIGCIYAVSRGSIAPTMTALNTVRVFACVLECWSVSSI